MWIKTNALIRSFLLASAGSVLLFAVSACTPAVQTGAAVALNSSPTISYENSLVSVSANSVIAGSPVVVTLHLEDTAFNPFIAPNETIIFQAVGGTSTGTFGPVTDNGDGSYTANFYSVNAGTPVGIYAYANGAEIQSQAPQISVVAGTYSLSLSTIAISATTVVSGSQVTATLVSKDMSGTQVPSGGLVVGFSTSGGTSTGTFAPTIDHGDGTYTSIFTGLNAGSATSIGATIQGHLVTSTNPTLTVSALPPASLTYLNNPAIYTKNNAIPNNSPSNLGGVVLSYSVSPTLPTGLSLNTSTGVISGTPTAITATASYTITATNPGGSTTASVSITVNNTPPSSLSYATNPAVYTKSSAIASNAPTSLGGTVVSYSVSPAFPAGLSLNTSTGVISGTPTAIAAASVYTVTATNGGGSTPASLSITVNDIPPSSLSFGTSTAVYTVNTAISNNVSTHSGGTVVSYSVSPALPAGLSLNSSTGIISGTPTSVAATATYTVTATNSGGSTPATVSITVNNIAPSSLTYSSNPATYTKNSAITNNTPSNLGGAVVSYSVSPALPAGLSLNTSTGVISGTPTALAAAATYTVTATNSGGSTPASLSITVNNLAPSSLTYSSNPAIYTKSSAITSNSPSNSGGVAASYSVSPALPAGLSLNTATGVISGTPTVVAAAATYTVTATNSGGSTPASVSITVNDIAPSSLTYSTNPGVYTLGTAISNNTPSNTGGTIVSYSVTPALPTGLTLNTSSGVISGTPTAVASVATYTITGTNSGGSIPVSVSITVNYPAPTVATSLTATAGAASVALTWTAPSGTFGTLTYNILRGATSGSETQYATSSSASYTDSSVTNGSTYYYVVQAVGGGGTSANSNEASTTVYAAPGIVTGLTAVGTIGQVALSWTAPAGSFGSLTYTIFRGTTPAGVTSYVTTSANATSYTDTGVVNGTKYYYLLFSNGSGGQSTYSTEVNATPTAPVNYYVSASGNDSNNGTSSATPWQTITKVNTKSYKPGDQILFNGGDTFSGTINFFSASVYGTAAYPITISSYGTGNATINAGNNSGLVINNTYGFNVSNLNFVGSGVSTNTGNGIQMWTNLSGNVQLSNFNFNQINVSGFGNSGFSFGSSAGTSGFNNINITNSVFHDIALNGILSYGSTSNSTAYCHSNITISGVTVYNIFGVSGLSQSSGTGIVLASVNGGTVQYSEVYNNGVNNTFASGPAGIWTFESNNILFQYNESHHNHTQGGDGDGFDLDGGVTNSIMQYNYSHDNDGTGYLLCTYSGATAHSGNITRYNISENDSRNVGYNGIQYGGIFLFSTVTNDQIYNNTIYMTPPTHGSPSGISTVNWTAGSNVTFRNNIIQTTGGVPLISTNEGTGMLFQGNDYWPTGGTFKIIDNSVTYSSLSAWQTAKGMEKNGSTATGLSLNPGLTSPGGGGTIGTPSGLATSLTAYKLSSGSSMRDAGLNLNSLFGSSIGSTDFYGNPVFDGTGYSVGASE